MRGVAWWVPILLILSGLGIASTAPIPITEVKVGNETIKVTTADILYRYLWGPLKHGMEKALSHVPGFVTENLTESIKLEFDRFDRNLQYLLQLDIVKENWTVIVRTIRNLNYQLTGEYSSKITLCAWKRVFEYCRTYELNPEVPEIKMAFEGKSKYLTIRVPYGILKSINEKIEDREYEKLVRMITKYIIRGELKLEKLSMQEMIQEMERIREHIRRHKLT